MSFPLRIQAGPKAYAHIQEHGLSPEHIAAVFGASGAAKWLAIYGLDKAIFGQWLSQSQQQVLLFGTSVGAFKLTAAGQSDSDHAFDELADAYISQSYPNGVNRDIVAEQTEKILDRIISPTAAEAILSHPRYRYACGTVRCKGLLASERIFPQQMGFLGTFLANYFGRAANRGRFDRHVFADPRADFPVAALDGYHTEVHPLSAGNFRNALAASGSIPVVMNGVVDIEGAPKGVYRDGGLLDYHPVPSQFWQDEGLILYPHFYSYVKPGWFDKYRKITASGQDLDNVLLLSPSESHLAKTKLGRIPDRQDFIKFKDDEPKRLELWWDAAEHSKALGEDFLSWVNGDALIDRVELLT